MSNKAQIFDSRQSMKNGQFEVFYYKDRRPSDIGVHHHDFYEIYFFLGGSVRYRIEGRTYDLEQGDILLINPLELHQAHIKPDTLYERIVIWINRNYLAELGEFDAGLEECFVHDPAKPTNLLRPDMVQRAKLIELMEKLNLESHRDRPDSALYAKSLLIQILIEVNRMARKETGDTDENEEPDLISRTLTYIGNHYKENISLDALASEFFVSKYYLSHTFSSRVGISIYRYIIFRRLMAARGLMESGEAPGEVYRRCGFGDYANFYRAFKAEYGISPNEYAAEFSSNKP